MWSKDSTVQAACFSVDKYSELNTLPKRKSPVKNRFQCFTKTWQRGQHDHQQDKNISYHKRWNWLFLRKWIDSNWHSSRPFSSWITCSSTTSYYQSRGCTNVCSKNTAYTISGVINKQEVVIRDTSTSVKLLLWETALACCSWTK